MRKREGEITSSTDDAVIFPHDISALTELSPENEFLFSVGRGRQSERIVQMDADKERWETSCSPNMNIVAHWIINPSLHLTETQ
jgi:hypothetical protein